MHTFFLTIQVFFYVPLFKDLLLVVRHLEIKVIFLRIRVLLCNDKMDRPTPKNHSKELSTKPKHDP